MGLRSRPAWERVLDRTIAAPNGCVICTFAPARDGYCQVYDEGKRPATHRVVYEHFRGPIPDGLTLDHSCRTPKCVNPWHLEPRSIWENSVLLGLGPAGMNAFKTRCKHGHPFSRENTRHTSAGRTCLTCERDRQRQQRGWKGGVHNRDKTHCKRNHELAGKNLRIGKKGDRICVACAREASREWWRKKHGKNLQYRS